MSVKKENGERQLKKELRENEKLLSKYPFLQSGGDEESGTWTWLNNVLPGWRDIFLAACDKIAKHLDDIGVRGSDARFLDVKEKWGELRVDFTPYDEEIAKILDALTYKSMLTCPFCGKPTKYATRGYVLYICGECGGEGELNKEKLDDRDIPKKIAFRESNGRYKTVEIEPPYINEFKEQWRG